MEDSTIMTLLPWLGSVSWATLVAVFVGLYVLKQLIKPGVPCIDVDLTALAAAGVSATPLSGEEGRDYIPCVDPGSGASLGYVAVTSPEEVRAAIERARVAQAAWRTSSFATRRRLLRVLLRYVTEHQAEICEVAVRDSGKPLVDAAFGEVMVTCEKLWWLIHEGARWLAPERRSAGRMMFYKKARVEFPPVGVVGAIVPWNYPFHNIFNPLSAALFAGNALVLKVSEHAAWSGRRYEAVVKRALALVGAPEDLFSVVTGYGETGRALVRGRVDKLIFVGSTRVGRIVLADAAEALTPVVLELGGKDAFVVLEDADPAQVLPTALRACFQSCGQNCAGAERFIVHERVAPAFCDAATLKVRGLRVGCASGAHPVDCGAMCLPGAAEAVQALVDDAVARGARLLAGGDLEDFVLARPDLKGGQFYPPTLLADVTPAMRIWKEEVFGPVMVVVSFATDAQAVALANDCAFGLGSSVFARDAARARRVAEQLHAGMASINDFAATYMCQSLPFGGVKESGFDRFAGVEGLRGLCVPKAVCEDRWPFATAIPPLLQYPVDPRAFRFVQALVKMFYSQTCTDSLKGLGAVIACFVLPRKKIAPRNAQD